MRISLKQWKCNFIENSIKICCKIDYFCISNINNHKVIFITPSSRTLHDNFSHVMRCTLLYFSYTTLYKNFTHKTTRSEMRWVTNLFCIECTNVLHIWTHMICCTLFIGYLLVNQSVCRAFVSFVCLSVIVDGRRVFMH